MVESSVAVRRSGAALVMVVWLLSSILVLCIIVRLLPRCNPWSRRRPSLADDVLVGVVVVLAMASMFIIASTGGAIEQERGHTVEFTDSRVKLYVSTVLFVLTTSLSKAPLFLWLKRLKLRKVYKASTIVVGCIVLICMMASTASVIFQCQLPTPWYTQRGRCISLQRFWTATISIDIALDLVLIVLPILAVMSLAVQQRRETWAAFVLSLRTLTIVASLVRLACVQQPQSFDGYKSTVASPPYVIATQCQVTLAAILACTLALPCLANLVVLPSQSASTKLSKHCSGSSLSSFASMESATSKTTTVIKEPLPAIQASMATLTSSPHGSVMSLPTSLTGKLAAPPPRPPRPLSPDTPDMSMFTRQPTVKRPPPVTLLGDITMHKQGNQSRESVRDSKHVKFDI